MVLRRIVAGLLLMTSLLVIVACGEAATPTPAPTPTPTSPLFPLTVADSKGGAILLEAPAQRIVAIDSAALEILFAMGEEDRIVATHDFVTYPPEAEQIKKVGGAFALNHEEIVALEPDLVFIFFESPVAGLEALGLPVLYLEEPDSLEGIAQRIRLWGRITGNLEGAEAVAVDYEGRLAQLEAKIAGLEAGPRVWIEVGDFWTAGGDSLEHHVYTRLGAQSISEDIEGYAQLSPEVVVDRDPEIIVTKDPDYEENIVNYPAFSQVSAVKTGRVVPMSGSFLEVAGPRMVDWAEELARVLYPDVFSTTGVPSDSGVAVGSAKATTLRQEVE